MNVISFIVQDNLWIDLFSHGCGFYTRGFPEADFQRCEEKSRAVKPGSSRSRRYWFVVLVALIETVRGADSAGPIRSPRFVMLDKPVKNFLRRQALMPEDVNERVADAE